MNQNVSSPKAAAPLPPYTVETWPIGRPKKYERNARTHSAKQLAQLRDSFRKFGQVWPILVREDGTIIAGHGRLEAAKAEGITEIRVIVATGWTEEQCRAFGLLDNKVALNSEWDEALLATELAELSGFGVDLGMLGFNPHELPAQAASDDHTALTEPDAAPDAPAVPITQRGDLWALGRHRLLCGDATQVDQVARLFGGVTADAILTDPPYCSGGFQEAGKSAGSIGSDGAKHQKGGAYQDGIANDRLSTRGYLALMKAVIGLTSAPILYAFTDWRMWINLYDVAESSGYAVRNMVVWNKGTPGMGVGWRTQHELVLFGSKTAIKFDNHKAQGNVIASKRTGNLLHPTQKPVDLLRAILAVTDMAKTVYDPFTGSGSTLIACEQESRGFFGAELSAPFIDVTIKRWQDFTGQKATLEGDGRTFDEIAAERLPAAA